MNPIEKWLDRRGKIEELKKNGDLEDILTMYGPRAYRNALGRKGVKEEVLKLVESHQTSLIKERLGKKVEKKYRSQIKYNEVLRDTGSKTRAWMAKMQFLIVHRILPTTLAATLMIPAEIGVLSITSADKSKAENEIKYTNEIDKNNNEKAKEVEYLKAVQEHFKLNDLDVIMYLMANMWDGIEGYADPDLDPTGFEDLSIYEEHKGVCRNFAPHIADLLNKLNPKYDAKVIIVKIGETFETANIGRTIIREKDEGEKTEPQMNPILKGILDATLGDHTVLTVNLNDVILVVDPTNPAIGIIYGNNDVYMFDTKDKSNQLMPMGQTILGSESTGDLIELIGDSKNIYGNASINEILEKFASEFGHDAQNESLEKMAKMGLLPRGNNEINVMTEEEAKEALRLREIEKEKRKLKILDEIERAKKDITTPLGREAVAAELNESIKSNPNSTLKGMEVYFSTPEFSKTSTLPDKPGENMTNGNQRVEDFER